MPQISQCNGECPQFAQTLTPHQQNNNNNNKSLLTQPQTALSKDSNHFKVFVNIKNGFFKNNIFIYQRRVLCGNSCLTGEEAKNKYHCGGHCQVHVRKIKKGQFRL